MRTILAFLITVMLGSAAWSHEIEFKGYSLAEWTALLKAEDETAWYALRFAGDDADDLLLALLDDGAPVVRRRALGLLTRAGVDRVCPLSMDRLASFLEDPDPGVRACAARTLAQCGMLANLFVDDLIGNLDEQDEDARYALIYSLSRRGEVAVRGLIEALADPRPMVRSGAAEALGEFERPSAAGVRALLTATGDGDAHVRARAARSLGNLHVEAEVGVPVLGGMLADESAEVREAAALALARFQEEAQPAGAALAGALSDSDESVRVAAGEALRRLGGLAAAYQPELLAALEDPAPGVRALAVSILTMAEDPSDEAVLAIARGVDDPDMQVRNSAAYALSELGTRARLAIPLVVRFLAREQPSHLGHLHRFFLVQVARSVGAMLTALEDADAEVRYAGLLGLRLMGRVPVPNELARVLREDPNARNREVAARILEKLGPRGWKAMPAIVAALADSERGVRVAAEAALAAVGERAVPAVRVLLLSESAADRALGWNLVSRMDPGVRIPAKLLESGLGSVDPADRLAAAANLFRVAGEKPDLIRRTMNEDGSAAVRIAAARSWFWRTGESAPAVAILVQALDADGGAHRPRAARGLAEIAVKEKLAPQIVFRLLGDPDPAVRMAGVKCLPGSRAGLFAGLAPPAASPVPVYSYTTFGEREERSLPLLLWAARHSPSTWRWTAIRDLADLPDGAGSIRPQLAAILTDESDRAREWAARSLAVLPRTDGEAADELRVALTDEDPAVRADAALAHFRVTGSAAVALQTLRGQLQSPDADARWQAVRALREMGAGIPEVRAALRLIVDDEDELVRLAARAAPQVVGGER